MLASWLLCAVIDIDDFDLSHTGDLDGCCVLKFGDLTEGMKFLRSELVIKITVNVDLWKCHYISVPHFVANLCALM